MPRSGTVTDIPQAAIDAVLAERGDLPMSEDDARRLLEAAAPHLQRPVYVLAIGHELADQDAVNIQRAVADVLRNPPTYVPGGRVT
jgi:hypothetical protein